MEEYKVEFVEVNKRYFTVTVEAQSRKEAIEKVKQSGIDPQSSEEYESASQSEWTASTIRYTPFSWISLFWTNKRRYKDE